MKNRAYFPHDGVMSQDVRCLRLRMRWSWEGYGLYWAIKERLRLSRSLTLPLDYKLLAYDLHTSEDLIRSLVEDFELFELEDGYFYALDLKEQMYFMQTGERASKRGNPNFKKGERNPYYPISNEFPSSLPSLSEEGKAESFSASLDKGEVREEELQEGDGKEKEEDSEELQLEREEESDVKQEGLEVFVQPTEKVRKRGKKKRTATRFTPPDVEDVRLFAQENNYQVDADRFIDYYTANGWNVGRNKMKDWKATLRNWDRTTRARAVDSPSVSLVKNVVKSANAEWV